MTPQYIIDAMRRTLKELKQLYCRLHDDGKHDEAEQVFDEATRLAKEVRDAEPLREM